MTAYTDKEIAAVAWAANAELQALHGDPDPSLPGDKWDADAHAVTLAGVRAALEGATPEQMHETWMRAREAQGWTHGLRKDSRLKTHPALVPYGDLPEAQRVKDRVFAAIVRAMAGQDAPELTAGECYEPGSVDVGSGERDITETAVVPATELAAAREVIAEMLAAVGKWDLKPGRFAELVVIASRAAGKS